MSYKNYPYSVLIRDAVEAVQNKNLSDVARIHILDNVIWGWTIHSGKYCGCPLWSEKALIALEGKISNTKIPLHHEHTTPRKIIIHWMLELGEQCTENDVLRILTKYAVAVVMLPEEHKQLHAVKQQIDKIPVHFDPSTLLRRYEDCAVPIKIMYATWNRGKALIKIPVSSCEAWAKTVLSKGNHSVEGYYDYEANPDVEIKKLWHSAARYAT